MTGWIANSGTSMTTHDGPSTANGIHVRANGREVVPQEYVHVWSHQATHRLRPCRLPRTSCPLRRSPGDPGTVGQSDDVLNEFKLIAPARSQLNCSVEVDGDCFPSRLSRIRAPRLRSTKGRRGSSRASPCVADTAD